ncbi:M23 family metallopeptidase [Poseidonibacter antarcticus]|uniref:M23 family metallopeptidase n=1 Tax=Poseidonibacter antarcticus TaxID=2478538 RepID=UPI000EF45BE1|nr:M23 family metallopeptidase [Poseidonibacter antarcticus]
MSYINRKKNNKAKIALVYIIIAIIIGLGAFVFLSPIFEKNSPKISLDKEIFWNLKSPLKVNFSDDTEISSYNITYYDDNNEIKLDTKKLDESKGSIDLNIIAPKIDLRTKTKNAMLKIEVTDTSKWNFFMGNKTIKDIKIKIDKKRPVANVISNSYLIKQGGSAAVVVEVKDENLEDFYISFNNEERFELFPFYKDNFYIALIAWPIDIKEFKRVNLVAIDKARNKTVTKVPLYIRSLNIKIDNMKISDKFINQVSKNVLTKSGYDIPDDQASIFIKENKHLRQRNVETIKRESLNNMNRDKVTKFNLKTFKRLPSSMKFAGYGERRNYTYEGKQIDEAWHLGVDWASVKNAKIYTSNDGKVIFKDYLGIYGNALIIDHGLGLGTLYAHTSKSIVEVGDIVNAGDYIANTGSTGAVFGDHLHFGVLIQGIEVNPIEWLSKQWINDNITKTINDAKKVIDKK